MCCCTASIIHTCLLTAVPSWLRLLNCKHRLQYILALALAYALCVTCSYSYSLLPGILLRGTNIPGNIRSLERLFQGTFAPGRKSSRELSFLWVKVPTGNVGAKIPGSKKSLNRLRNLLYSRLLKRCLHMLLIKRPHRMEVWVGWVAVYISRRSPTVKSFKLWLDRFWANEEICYNYKTIISCTGSQSNYDVDLEWLLLLKFMCKYCIFTLDWTSRTVWFSFWLIFLVLVLVVFEIFF